MLNRFLLPGLLSLVPVLSCTRSDAPQLPPGIKQQNIINGTACTNADHPSAVAIMLEADISSFFGNMHVRMLLCTGTVIAPDTVLAAAHCVDLDLLGQSVYGTVSNPKFYISFTDNLKKYADDPETTDPLPSDVIQASYWVKQSDWNPNSISSTPGLGRWNDASLIFLSKPIPLSQLQPAVIPTKTEAQQIAKNTPAYIVGWGQSDPDDANSAGIRICASSTLTDVGTWEMQIGGGTAGRKCHGDSGGPTYMEFTTSSKDKVRVIGITSHAYDQSDCAKGGIDTRVDAFYDWINSTMQDGCSTHTNGTRVWCDVTGVLPADFGGTVVTDGGVDLGPQPDGVGTRDYRGDLQHDSKIKTDKKPSSDHRAPVKKDRTVQQPDQHMTTVDSSTSPETPDSTVKKTDRAVKLDGGNSNGGEGGGCSFYVPRSGGSLALPVVLLLGAFLLVAFRRRRAQ